MSEERVGGRRQPATPNHPSGVKGGPARLACPARKITPTHPRLTFASPDSGRYSGDLRAASRDSRQSVRPTQISQNLAVLESYISRQLLIEGTTVIPVPPNLNRKSLVSRGRALLCLPRLSCFLAPGSELDRLVP